MGLIFDCATMPETEGECKTLRIKIISMGAAECGKVSLVKVSLSQTLRETTVYDVKQQFSLVL